LKKHLTPANRAIRIPTFGGKQCFIPHKYVARADLWKGQFNDCTSFQGKWSVFHKYFCCAKHFSLGVFSPALVFLTLSNQLPGPAEFSTFLKPNIFIGSRFLAAAFKGA